MVYGKGTFIKILRAAFVLLLCSQSFCFSKTKSINLKDGRTLSFLSILREVTPYFFEKDLEDRREEFLCIYNNLLDDGFSKDQIKNGVDVALRQDDSLVKEHGLILLACLVKDGFFIKDAEDVVKKEIFSDDEFICKAAFFLLITLAYKGNSINLAKNIVTKFIDNSNISIRNYAFLLYEELMIRGWLEQSAYEKSREFVNKKNLILEQRKSISCCYALMKKGLNLKESLLAARHGINSKDDFIVERSIRIYSEFFHHFVSLTHPEVNILQYLADIDYVIKKHYRNTSVFVKVSILSLCTKFINHNMYSKDIEESISSCLELESNNEFIVLGKLIFYLRSAVAGRNINAAINFAKRAGGFTSKHIKVFLAQLYSVLVDKGFAIDDARKYITFDIDDNDVVLKHNLDLIKTIIKRTGDSDFTINVIKRAYFSKINSVKLYTLSILCELDSIDAENISSLVGDFIKSDDDYLYEVGLSFCKKLAEHGLCLDDGLNTARNAIKSDRVFIQSWGLDIYASLVSYNMVTDEALSVAKKFINSSSSILVSRAIDLFGYLSYNDLYIDDALAVAERFVDSSDFYISSEAGSLYLSLIKKKLVSIDDAIEIISQSLNNPTSKYFSRGIILLYKNLLADSKDFKIKLVELIRNGLRESNDFIWYRYVHWFSHLLKEGLLIDDFMKLANDYRLSGKDKITRASILYRLLIGAGCKVDQITSIACELISDTSNQDSLHLSGSIFFDLIWHAHAKDLAKKIADEIIDDADFHRTDAALLLYKYIVDFDYAADMSSDISKRIKTNFMLSDDSSNNTWNLWIALVSKKYLVQEAEELLRNWISQKSEKQLFNKLRLCKGLVTGGHGLDLTLRLINIALDHRDDSNVMLILDLCLLFIRKGLCISQVKVIIEKIEKPRDERMLGRFNLIKSYFCNAI